MYDSILLPTDGSDGAGLAVEKAIALAAEHDATLLVLNVVDITAASAIPEAQAKSIRELLSNAGEAHISEVADQASKAGVVVESLIREGNAAAEILDVAEAESVDLIVMGTHGRSGIDRLLLGSVADRVIRHSPVSVLITK